MTQTKTYCLVNPQGDLIVGYVRYSAIAVRQEFIEHVIKSNRGITWKDAYKLGYRVEPVTITPRKK